MQQGHSPSIQKHLLTCILVTACITSALFGTHTTAQNLTGVWQGKFYSSAGTLMSSSTYKYEVQIVHDGKKLNGVTYSYLTTAFYGKASLVGFFKEKENTVVIKETQMLEMKAAEGSDGCLMTCTLQYIKKGNEAYLTGTYTSVSIYTGSACGGGTVLLHKTDHSDFYKEKILLDHSTKKAPSSNQTKPVAKPINPTPPIINPPTQPKPKQLVDTPVTHIPTDTALKPTPPTVLPVTPAIKEQKEVLVKNTPTVLKERNNEVVKTIYTNASLITVKLYDNGEIDKDTITVYHNNQIVVYKQQLDVKPIVVRIEINEKNPYHEFTLVANNLGEIPPNTALMIVTAGEKRYEIQLASTEQKNAKVVFEYKKTP